MNPNEFIDFLMKVFIRLNPNANRDELDDALIFICQLTDEIEWS